MVGPTSSAHFSVGLHIPVSGSASSARGTVSVGGPSGGPIQAASTTPHLVERFSSDAGRTLAAAQHAPAHPKSDSLGLADYAAGRSQQPPAGWRAAGTADLSALGIRAENLSSLPGNQFARVFVSAAKGEGRIAIVMQNNPGAQQQWLKDGGAKYGPSVQAQVEAQNLAQTIRASGHPDVTVISAKSQATASVQSLENSHSTLKWAGIPGPLIAYAQSMGRQLAI